MYNFGKKKNQKLMAAIVIIVVATMLITTVLAAFRGQSIIFVVMHLENQPNNGVKCTRRQK